MYLLSQSFWIKIVPKANTFKPMFALGKDNYKKSCIRHNDCRDKICNDPGSETACCNKHPAEPYQRRIDIKILRDTSAYTTDHSVFS